MARSQMSPGSPASGARPTDLIFSLGDEATKTADRVRSLQSVASSLDALGGGGVQSAVLMKGFARLGEMLNSMNTGPWKFGDEIAEDFGYMTWEATQEPGALYATIRVQKIHDSSVQDLNLDR